MTTTEMTSRPVTASIAQPKASWLSQVFLFTRRNLVTIGRTPEAVSYTHLTLPTNREV